MPSLLLKPSLLDCVHHATVLRNSWVTYACMLAITPSQSAEEVMIVLILVKSLFLSEWISSEWRKIAETPKATHIYSSILNMMVKDGSFTLLILLNGLYLSTVKAYFITLASWVSQSICIKESPMIDLFLSLRRGHEQPTCSPISICKRSWIDPYLYLTVTCVAPDQWLSFDVSFCTRSLIIFSLLTMVMPLQ